MIPVLLGAWLALPAAAAPSADSIEARVSELLGRMTLEEKLGQLQQLDGDANGDFRPEHLELARKGRLGSTLNVRGARRVNELQKAALESRLRIPILFAFDVIHGYRTVFPIPLAEAASWDPAAVERAAAVAAAEAAAAGVKWTFAPMVDVARDPRWGRVAEGSGEDPHLGSVLAAARVRGFQGNDPAAADKVLACAKHWVGYGAAEGGRDYNTTDVSEHALRTVYLPPFKAAVDAGVATMMSAFNDLSGVPASANRYTLTGILREEWGWDGLVVSDYTSVQELVAHGYAADGADAARKALTAGVDMEMVSRLYGQHGGSLPQDAVDEAVRRVLRAKFRAGLFEKPYADEDSEAVIGSEAFRAEARRMAVRSLVLLKNEGVLPLPKTLKTLAVVGELADSQGDLLGSWTGDGRPGEVVTIRDAIQAALPGTLVGEDPSTAETTVVVIGETAGMSGEAASRSELGLRGVDEEVLEAVQGSGKPFAVVLLTGRPVAIPWLAEHAPALLLAWQPGSEGGRAVADVLFGDESPGGKLPATFPRAVGQVPIHYNHKSTGRPYDANSKYTTKYLDLPETPLYPFGWGLSYTTFTLSGLEVADSRVSVEVANAGARPGDEVVQVYLRAPPGGPFTRPVRELAAFRRVTLAPGERRRLDFALEPDAPGRWQVFVGTSSVGGLAGEFVHR